MQKISPVLIDEIRHKANIVDIIGEYVQLKKSGRNYSGLCPFHDEKTPSFSVTEEKQIFKCFGCGKGGNVFTFIQELEGVTFLEAVKHVADYVHVPLEIEKEELSEKTKFQRRLIAMHQKAKEIYQHLLIHTKAGEQALQYLEKRGITEDVFDHFQIGYAPGTGKFLLEILNKENFTKEECLASGLFSESQNGELFDRFKDRIMFPLWNQKGEVVGFSGRIYNGEKNGQEPKYLNSPETPIFEKRYMLYHFSSAKRAMRKAESCFIFEGFMDVIAAFQGGIENAVASMGTSFTSQQLQLLEKNVPEIVLCFDGDNPGQQAIDKSLGEIKQLSKIRMKVVLLPEKLDPDEFLRKYGQEKFRDFLTKQQVSAFQFKEIYLKNKYQLNNEQEVSDYLKDLLEELLHVSSNVERDILLHSLAETYHVSYDILASQFQHLYQENNRRQNQVVVPLNQMMQTKQQKLTQKEKAQQLLLYRIFFDEGVRRKMRTMTNFSFVNDYYQELYLLMDTYALEGGELESGSFLDFLKGKENLTNLATSIFMLNPAPETSELEIQELLTTLFKNNLQEEIAQKQRLQNEAHRLGNTDLEMQLAVEILQLRKQMK